MRNVFIYVCRSVSNLRFIVVVSKVYYLNSDKYPVIVEDVQQVKKRVDKKEDENFTCVFEALPQYRRTGSLPDKINNGDYIPALGAIGLTAVNWKEDLRDIESAVKQIRAKINPNYSYDPLYNRNTHQHAFSFTKGIVGEETLYKASINGNPFAQIVLDMDRTIDKTKFGEFIKKIFGIEAEDAKKVSGIKNYRGQSATAYKFKSSVLGGEMLARGMKRTTLLGVAFMEILELPNIVKASMKGDNIFEHVKNGTKQTVKSTGNVVLTTAGIAIGGAIGAKYLGATGSLVGMGLGAILANKSSKKLQEVLS